MTREPNEVYPPAEFDADAHIAAFLQISSVYLGVSADQVMASTPNRWQPIPAILAREAQHA
jgi:hypothetical protein